MKKVSKFFHSVYKLSFLNALLICLPVWTLIVILLVHNFYKPYSHPDVDNVPISHLSIKDHFRVMNLYLYRNIFYPLRSHLETKEENQLLDTQKVEIVINEDSLSKLFSDLPQSGKMRWYQARIKIEGSWHHAEVKLRGSSYWHWDLSHKSWRVRLQSGLWNGLKEFDIVRVKQSLPFLEPLSLELAGEVELPNVKGEPKLLYVNGKISGYSFLLENPNLHFAAKNSMALGSIYGVEREIKNLEPWNNPLTWLSIYGEDQPSDRQFLGEFLSIISNLDKKSFYYFMMSNKGFDTFVRYLAFDSVLGIIHHDKTNSVRLYVDSSLKQIYPIPWDHVLWAHVNDFEASKNPITDIWNLIPQLRQKVQVQAYEFMKGPLASKRLIKRMEEHYLNSKAMLQLDKSRCHVLYPWERCYLPIHFRAFFPYTMEDLEQILRHEKYQVKQRSEFLKEYFENSEIKAHLFWDGEKNVLQILSMGNISQAIENVKGLENRELIRDLNQNLTLDIEERVEKVDSLKGEVFYPGLINATGIEQSFASTGIRKSVPLLYTFFIEGRKIPSLSLTFRNTILPDRTHSLVLNSEKKSDFNYFKTDSLHPWQLNEKKQNKELLTWGPGEVVVPKSIEISKNQILKILPNTSLVFSTETKLVIKGMLDASGTKEKPIRFKSKNGESFGPIVITSAHGSRCHYCIFDGRRLDTSVSNDKMSLLQIMDVENFSLENVEILGSEVKDSSIFGLSLKNFTFKNLEVSGALSHGIKLISSSGILEGVKIQKSLRSGLYMQKSHIKMIESQIFWTGKSSVELKDESELQSKNVKFLSLEPVVDSDKSSRWVQK